MIDKVRLKTRIIWYFPLILIVVKITRPLRSYRTPKNWIGLVLPTQSLLYSASPNWLHKLAKYRPVAV